MNQTDKPKTMREDYERNWPGVIQNLYDSGFIDGQNNHRVLSTPNAKVMVVVSMVNQLLTSQLQSVFEEIEKRVYGMGFTNPAEAGAFAMHNSGYNQAIEEVLGLVKNLHQEYSESKEDSK
jgi:DNA-binding ferritin-like protein (Dps family)